MLSTLFVHRDVTGTIAKKVGLSRKSGGVVLTHVIAAALLAHALNNPEGVKLKNLYNAQIQPVLTAKRVATAELTEWAEKNTPEDCISTADLVTSSALKFSAHRSVTMHPQYEFKRVRDRDATYSYIYGMSTDKEVYDLLSKELNSDYFGITMTSCYMVAGETRAINNRIIEEKGFDPKIPNWCATVAARLEDNTSPYFELVYANRHFIYVRLLKDGEQPSGKSLKDHLLETDPNAAESLCGYADQWLRGDDNRMSKHRSYMEAATTVAPIKTSTCLCEQASKAGKSPRAKKIYDRVLPLGNDPRGSCLFGAAIAFENINLMKQAGEYFKQALEKFPSQHQFRSAYGWFLIDRNPGSKRHIEQAKKVFAGMDEHIAAIQRGGGGGSEKIDAYAQNSIFSQQYAQDPEKQMYWLTLALQLEHSFQMNHNSVKDAISLVTPAQKKFLPKRWEKTK